MKIMFKSIKKVVLVVLLISTNCFAQQLDFEKLDAFFEVLETNNKLMATMTITKNETEVYKKSVGFSDVTLKTKHSENTKFRIGSITKTFTAVIIFQLIDEGKLSLETKLSKYFPRIANASNITIANLLNHSSGLFNITNSDDAGSWIYETSSQNDMLSRIEKFETNFSPGEKMEYSNTNYMLLGYIAETIDKKLYKHILEDRIIKKINLKNTYYGSEINANNNESSSYAIQNGEWSLQLETNMSNPGGAGAIVSTSKDLTIFMNALFNNKLISKDSFEIMKTHPNDDDTCHGIFYANMNGLDIYASEGGIDGFQSMLVHIPATKTTIALTGNALDFSKMRIMLSAFAVSHGQPIEIPKFGKIEITEAIAKQYEGEYACDKVPYKLIFKANGNILMGAPEQSNLKELTPTKQHQFTFDTLGIVLDFYPEAGSVRFTQPDKEPLVFEKL